MRIQDVLLNGVMDITQIIAHNVKQFTLPDAKTEQTHEVYQTLPVQQHNQYRGLYQKIWRRAYVCRPTAPSPVP